MHPMLRRVASVLLPTCCVSSTAAAAMMMRGYASLPDLVKPRGSPAELPKLPFDWKDGCAPVLSARQMELHYTKHHKAYVDKLNALAGDAYDGKTIEEIILAVRDDGERKVLFNQAAQHFNHTFYFNCLTPHGTAMPKSLESAIAAQFGSVEKFKDMFVQAGTNNFGSGWTWLCVDPANKKQLVIENSSNAGCPMTKGLRPIFAVDVWEHAYYKDFENRRPDYLKEIWSIVNWEFVAKMHAQALK